MSLIQFPGRHRQAHAPILALVDLQKEYVSEGRAFSIGKADNCLANCRRLLAAARERGLPVAHFRQLLSGPFFNESTEFSRWIDEFRPMPSEMVYQRSMPSCYQNEFFCTFMEAMAEPVVLLAGFTADHACLSTVIDAVHRGHRVAFIQDASASQSLGSRTAHDSHAFMTDLISEYCEVISTQEALDRFTHADPKRWQAMGE